MLSSCSPLQYQQHRGLLSFCPITCSIIYDMPNAASIVEAKTEKVTLEFNPHPAQLEIAEAALNHRFVVVRAGRRFGKSALCLNLILREAFANPGRYWLIAPEFTQAKSIYWRGLVDEYVPKGIVTKKNDTEMILEIMTREEGKKSIIEFKGSDREDKLRGAGLDGVILDEFAFQKDTVWEKIVGPMLLQTRGWAMFITTPNGISNHFKKFWDTAVAREADGDKDWKTFHFTSYDYKGPKWKEIHEDLEKDKQRYTTEFFTQEYLADFAKMVGQIFTQFDPKVHIRDFEVDESWTFFRSIDFGATDPNAVLFVGVDKDGVMHVFDEIYMGDLRTSELAELIKDKSAHRYYTATYGDSAAKQSILDLGTFGIYATPVQKNLAAKETNTKNWIIAGIDRIQQLLKDNKIVVHPRCKGLIKEFHSYSWRTDRTNEPVNLPEDKNNHAIDSFRYFVMMFQAGQYSESQSFNYLGGQADNITGY